MFYTVPLEAVTFPPLTPEAETVRAHRTAPAHVRNLKQSIRTVGLKEPLQVVCIVGTPGAADARYELRDGHCRHAVLCSLSREDPTRPKTVDVRIVDDIDTVEAMLRSDVRNNLRFSDRAHLAGALLSRGESEHRVAELAQITINDLGALLALRDAPDAVVARVDTGEMAWTVWRKVCKLPRATQDDVARLDKPTAKAVRRLVTTIAEQAQPDRLLDDPHCGVASVEALFTALTQLSAIPTPSPLERAQMRRTLGMVRQRLDTIIATLGETHDQ